MLLVRKQNSGGQALVLVTLAIITMAGMMGLAVDLGWSFYVQKQAQTAADAAALAAAHRAYELLGGKVSILSSCPSGLDCTGGDCSMSVDTTKNLYVGCLYAKANGFNWDDSSSSQTVNIKADVGGSSYPPTIKSNSVQNIAYWVTVRTYQTIPQLFSAVLRNTQGTVAAVSTAAITRQIYPGSFVGMNREGDCQTTAAGNQKNCGVDINISGAGNATCLDNNGNSTGYTASVCGPGGIFMASQCDGLSAISGCVDSGNSQNFSGQTHGNSSVWGSTIQIRGSGNVDDCSASANICGSTPNWKPSVTNHHSGGQFTDPTSGQAQPPVAPALGSTALTSCEITNNGGNTTLMGGANLGPFQYYSVNKTTKLPDGKPLVLSNNTTFSASGLCPGTIPGGGTSSNMAGSPFPSYVFYGGVDASGGANFGPGQYVYAGTTTQTGNPNKGDSGFVFNATGGNTTLTGDTTYGTMFIFSDANYPGLTQAPAITTATGGATPTLTFYQGFAYFKNTTTTMQGISTTLPNAASALQEYSDTLFWMDRRNTSLQASGYYDSTTNAWTSGTVPSGYHSTNTSPQIIIDSGNSSSVLTGVMYQPRGAWLQINSGNAAVASSPLQILTGAVTITNGAANVVLKGATKPLVIYKTALIQ